MTTRKRANSRSSAGGPRESPGRSPRSGEKRAGAPPGEVDERKYRDDEQSSNQSDAVNTIYGLIPVLEVLRAGSKKLEQITIVEGARHERLRELLELARRARVPVHRAPRFALDRALPGVTHQG